VRVSPQHAQAFPTPLLGRGSPPSRYAPGADGRFASGAAPTEFSVVICFSPLVGLPDSLVRKDQREVCPLSRGVMSPKAQLLSIPLQNGIRFFPRPLPAPLSTRLAVCLPIGKDTGSGSRAGLLPPSPLRTRRISFPIASSSLFCRPFYRTRL
jgi:hypothetical protein